MAVISLKAINVIKKELRFYMQLINIIIFVITQQQLSVNVHTGSTITKLMAKYLPTRKTAINGSSSTADIKTKHEIRTEREG